jgi:hypothetical protein
MPDPEKRFTFQSLLGHDRLWPSEILDAFGKPRSASNLSETNYPSIIGAPANYDVLFANQHGIFSVEAKNVSVGGPTYSISGFPGDYSSAYAHLLDAGRVPSTPSSSAFLEALGTLQVGTQSAIRASQLANSTRGVFLHVLSDERVVLDRDQVDELVEEQSRRLHEMARERANIEAFQRNLRAYLGDPQALQPRPPSEGAAPRLGPQYWSRVRDDLQEWFSVGLQPLSELIGVAKGTLLALVQPDRDLRGPTVRKLQAVHSSARAIVQTEGSRGLTWLRTTGSAVLRDDGLEKFEEAVDRRLLTHRPEDHPIGAASIEDESPPATRADADLSPYTGMKGRF